MFKEIDKTKKFSELADCNTPAFTKLSREMNTDLNTLVGILNEAYEKALEENRVTCDDSGWRFDTDFAVITLKRNTDFCSDYERYMAFTLKEGFKPFSEKAEDSIENPAEPPETLDEVRMVWKNLKRLNVLVNGEDESPTDEMLRQLKEAYRTARMNQKLVPYEDQALTFDTGFSDEHGTPIIASIKPSTRTNDFFSWYLNFIGVSTVAARPISKELEDFAELGRTYLTELAELANSEKWYFGEKENLEILRNYVAYTFYRIQREEKLCINQSATFAAFNTGLASAAYEDIYMCFKNKGTKEDPRWQYAGVCTEARGYYGKQLVINFNPLPQPAKYIERMEDVLYDMDKQLYPDFQHICSERLHRIPLEFLKEVLGNNAEATDILKKIEQASWSEASELYEDLEECVTGSAQLQEALEDALDRVVKKTVKILRWNYRLAIPCYYPKRNKMSLLLPMDFTNSGKPQAALVVELTESGNYLGHTLLNMRHAYLNARLISSQESSWLTA